MSHNANFWVADAMPDPLSARHVAQPSDCGDPAERAPAVKALPHAAELVRQWALRTPASPAVVAGDATLDFAELVARAERLAAALQAAGVVRGDRVAIAIERSAAMVVGLLAVLHAGAAYVPLDAQAPTDRIRFMLEDSNAACVLLGASTANLAGAVARPSLRADDPRWADPAAPRPAPSPALLDGDLAYCIYTSGTTGVPKAVAVTHGGLAHLVAWHRAAFDVTPLDRALQFANLAFDAATWDIWGALCAGASVCLAPASLPSLDELASLIARHHVTLAFLPTPLVELLIDSGQVLPATLRLLLTGGDRLRRSRHAFRARLVNNYGPTECTVVATSCALPVATEEAPPAAPPPIGAPISRTGASLLDDRLQPVRDGDEGQLFLRGAGLARGYLGRPDLTAERFVPDPFGPPGSRMYATGDLCRRHPDGSFDYVGRIDAQVKLRGYRIELGEIEATLLACPDVAQAAVAVHQDERGTPHLVACVVPREGAQAAPAGLAAALGARLPDYMVPSRWLTMAELPLNASGKIDRRALPTGSATALPLDGPSADAAPPSALETAICRVWAELLGLAQVPLQASFRSLGGSSIQAIDAVARLSGLHGHRLELPRLEGRDTVRTYAARMESAAWHGGWPSVPESPWDGPDGRGPLSRAQEQVCFLEMLDGAWRAYRSHALLRLRGAFDIALFEGAIDDLLARHDVLRAAFVEERGVWSRRQVVLPATRLKVLDLSHLTTQEQPAALTAAVARELDHRFLLSHPPIVRWWVARLSGEEHVVVQSEHHNVHDGQSFRLMVHELAELYSARVQTREPALPAVEAPYARYCAEERLWLESASFRAQLQEWVDRLRDLAPAGRLFGNHLAAGQRRFRGRQVRRRIEAPLAERLREIARGTDVSLFTLGLAAFGLACGRVAGHDRFLVGTAVANRPGPVYRQTVGMFVNAVAIRFDLRGQTSLSQLAQAVAEELDFALSRSAVPMNEIVRSLRLSRILDAEAPFNVCFSFHDSLPLRPRFAGLEVSVEEGLGNGSAKFDLNVVAIVDNDSMQGAIEMVFEHDVDRLPLEVVERVATGLMALLQTAAYGADAASELTLDRPAAATPKPTPPFAHRHRIDESDLDAVGQLLPTVLGMLGELMPDSTLRADDDIFSKGFHSLLLMQFLARCRDRLGREMPLREVYRLGTARHIAGALADRPVALEWRIRDCLQRVPGVRGVTVQSEPGPSGKARQVAQVVAEKVGDFVPEPGEMLITVPSGHRVSSLNASETMYQYQEIFKDRIYVDDKIGYPQDAVVLDVGANIGMFSLFVSRALPAAVIYAFEPVAPIRQRLERNMRRYAPRVRVLTYGLSDTQRSEAFTFYPAYSMMSGQQSYADADGERQVVMRYLSNAAAEGDESARFLLDNIDDVLDGRFEGEPQECMLRRMSDFIDEQRLERIDVLKIDVQRAELDVLKGIEPRHFSMIRAISMELHDDPHSPTVGRRHVIAALLRDAGFVVNLTQARLLASTDRWNLVAYRPQAATGSDAVDLSSLALALPHVTQAQLRETLLRELPECESDVEILLSHEAPDASATFDAARTESDPHDSTGATTSRA